MRIPELVAHRGYTLYYPENTLEGIDAAIRAGARHIEVDIQLSADKVPVLFHDRNLQRVCNANGMVHELPMSRLRSLRATEYDRFGHKFAQTPLAALVELIALLSRHPQVHAFIEIKRVAIERFGVDTVLEQVAKELRPALRQCTLISYSQEFLRTARRQGFPSIGVILEKWHHRKLGIVRQMHPDYLFCDADDLPRWGSLHVEGSKVAVYEITDPQQALRLAARGVDMIETFAIGEMLTALELLHPARK